MRVNGRSIAEVPGWFYAQDVAMFDWFLRDQAQQGVQGDLVELGAYLGKSAVLLGGFLRPGEKLTVVDLFGLEPDDAANLRENASSYPNLTRRAFEENYRRFHGDSSSVVVVQGLSSEVLEHAPAGGCRFVHVDASHLYEHVHGDALAARQLLVPDGVVVFDDYRSVHTPGVSAAVWEAVLTGGLQLVAATPWKLYGTWGDAAPLRERLVTWLEPHPEWFADVQEVAGQTLVRMDERMTGRKKLLRAAVPPGLLFRSRHLYDRVFA